MGQVAGGCFPAPRLQEHQPIPHPDCEHLIPAGFPCLAQAWHIGVQAILREASMGMELHGLALHPDTWPQHSAVALEPPQWGFRPYLASRQPSSCLG